MKSARWLLAAAAIALTGPAQATHVARPIPAQAPPPASHGLVQVHPAFPIHRAPVYAYHPHHRRHGHLAPRVFLPVLVWPGVMVIYPPPTTWILWADARELLPRYGWTELEFDVHAAGRTLLLQLDQPAQLDFAEITYQDGAAQVVDFGRTTRPPGAYELAPLDRVREVAYVRVVGRASGPRALLTLRLSR